MVLGRIRWLAALVDPRRGDGHPVYRSGDRFCVRMTVTAGFKGAIDKPITLCLSADETRELANDLLEAVERL